MYGSCCIRSNSGRSRKTRDELITEMSAQLETRVPGVAFGFTQPIEMRVDELVAGVKADVAVLLYGDDLAILGRLGKEIERVLRDIEGAVDVKADYQANVPTLSIRPPPGTAGPLRRERRRGDAMPSPHWEDILSARSLKGGPRFPIIVRFPASWREDVELLKQIPVHMVGGQPVTLGSVADIKIEETPPGIEHEAGRRRTFIQANVRNRDVATFVRDAQEAVRQQVNLPARLYAALGWRL